MKKKKKEKKEKIKIKYTDSNSVYKIMDAFGTTGFLNSEMGLYCFRPQFNINVLIKKNQLICGFEKYKEIYVEDANDQIKT